MQDPGQPGDRVAGLAPRHPALAHARAARPLRPFVAPRSGVVLVGEDASSWAGHTLTCLVLERLVTSGFSPQQWWDLLETAMADPTWECPSCGRPPPQPDHLDQRDRAALPDVPAGERMPGDARAQREVELELDAVDGSSLLLDEDATITAYGPDGDAVDAVPFGAVGSNAQVWARYARTMGVDPVLLAGALAYAAIADADDRHLEVDRCRASGTARRSRVQVRMHPPRPWWHRRRRDR